VRCGGPGLARLAAAGHAPRLRRASGGGVPTGRVRFPVAPSRWAAALPRPQVHTGGTPHGKHAPCACMSPLRAPCVLSLCAHFGSSLCVPALHTPACPYCVHGDPCSLSSTCACSSPCPLRAPMRCVLELCAFVLGVWCTCAVFARSCGIRSSTSSTSRGCAGPCFVLALCMLASSRLRLPCSRCVYLLCMRLLCMLALCALALHMLALRASAVRALAVRARAVRLCAGCGVLVQRSPTSCGFPSSTSPTHFQRPSAPSDAPARRPLMLMHMHLPYPLPTPPMLLFQSIKDYPRARRLRT